MNNQDSGLRLALAWSKPHKSKLAQTLPPSLSALIIIAFGSILQLHGILLTLPIRNNDEFERVIFAAAIVITKDIELFESSHVAPKFEGDVFLDVVDGRLGRATKVRFLQVR